MAQGKRWPVEVKARFWALLADGVAVRQAAVMCGVSTRSAWVMVAEIGGVDPVWKAQAKIRRCQSGRYLSAEERVSIGMAVAAGVSIRQIAKRLGRSPSTVSRELARHDYGGGYEPLAAHRQAGVNARRPKPAKLATNARLRAFVAAQLQLKHSPAQISRRLRVEFGEDKSMQVSHETIYQALYVQGRGGLRRELAACLRTGRAVRRSKRPPGQEQRRGRIPNMVMISERPAEADDRAVPGHWEGDLIMGANNRSAIGTLVERSTRFLMLLHLDGDHTAERVAEQMIAQMGKLPEHLRRSMTWDQGKEMAEHHKISTALDMPIYFCDPHSPWQRGTNENTNGLLRQYFPKGTNLAVHDSRYLDYVAWELNTRPRMTLNWLTPAETLNRLLSEPFETTGVATTT